MKIPIQIVHDGYGGYYSLDILDKTTDMKYITVLLGKNSTHLIHPLYISILNQFKYFLKTHTGEHMIGNMSYPFPKVNIFKFYLRCGNK